jgi:hypothetical protein
MHPPARHAASAVDESGRLSRLGSAAHRVLRHFRRASGLEVIGKRRHFYEDAIWLVGTAPHHGGGSAALSSGTHEPRGLSRAQSRLIELNICQIDLLSLGRDISGDCQGWYMAKQSSTCSVIQHYSLGGLAPSRQRALPPPHRMRETECAATLQASSLAGSRIPHVVGQRQARGGHAPLKASVALGTTRKRAPLLILPWPVISKPTLWARANARS